MKTQTVTEWCCKIELGQPSQVLLANRDLKDERAQHSVQGHGGSIEKGV